MRFVVSILILLAVIKIAGKEWLFRQAADEIILTAYKGRATQACETAYRSKPGAAKSLNWQDVNNAHVQIGDPNLRVFIWQTDHEAWAGRYKNPFIHLMARQPDEDIGCVFDIVSGKARIGLN